MNERVLPQVQAAEMGFLRRLHGLTLRDKVSWISSRFSEKRGPCYVGPTICPECPKNDWRGKSCWLHLQESGPEALKSPGSVSKSPILLDPYLRLLLIVRYRVTQKDVYPWKFQLSLWLKSYLFQITTTHYSVYGRPFTRVSTISVDF